MERQYIGARYVPLFYKNPDDGSANWKSGVGYDNLTIVVEDGDSYTSRIPVPVGIGKPSLNPHYWVKTGDFNAQLHNIEQIIANFEEEISKSLNKIQVAVVKNSGDGTSLINGNCMILKGETKTAMFDLSYDHNFSNIVEALNKLKITHIDYLIISHYHADHANTPNLQGLANMRFVDANTVIYTPRVPQGTAWSDSLATIYADFMVVVETIGCATIVPNSLTEIEFDGVNINFRNCDASDYAYYDSQSADYNAYSVINFIKYANLTIGNLGDIIEDGKTRMASTGNIERCDIITAPHHGVASFIDAFDNYIHPAVVVVPSNGRNLFRRNLSSNNELTYYGAIDAKICATSNKTVYININELFYDVYDDGLDYAGARLQSFDIYVDGEYLDDEYGTQSQPFTTIEHAIAYANKIQQGTAVIHCSNIEVTDNLLISDLSTPIKIDGCTFKGSVRIQDCTVELSNCVFNTTESVALRFDNCIAHIANCTISGNGSNGLWCRKTSLTGATNGISNKTLAIRISLGSIVHLSGTSGSGNTNLARIEDNSKLDMTSTTITYSGNMLQDSGTGNISGDISAVTDISTMLGSNVTTGEMFALLRDNMVEITGHITDMTGTGVNTTVGAITDAHLKPVRGFFVPIILTDTGYSSGNLYNGFLNITSDGTLKIVCQDYASMKQCHFRTSYMSALS